MTIDELQDNLFLPFVIMVLPILIIYRFFSGRLESVL